MYAVSWLLPSLLTDSDDDDDWFLDWTCAIGVGCTPSVFLAVDSDEEWFVNESSPDV